MKEIKVKAIDNVKPMNKATKEKHEFNKVMGNLKQTVKNIENFISSVALLTVSGVSFWQAYTHGFQLQYAQEVVMFFSIYIGLKGSHLFLNHINHKR